MPLSTTDLHLQQLKWPIEYLFVGAKVRDYFAGGTDALKRQYLDVWDKYSVITNNTYQTSGQVVLQTSALVEDPTAQTLGINAAGQLTGTANAAQAINPGQQIIVAGATFISAGVAVAAGAALAGLQLDPVSGTATAASLAVAAASSVVSYQGLEIQTQSCAPILDTISIKAHGIDIYKEMPAAFFNAYTTYHFGGPNINAPKDCGSLFVPFCLYPGTYQPSGHVNVSRAREFYFQYSSAYQTANPAVNLTLVVIASAINFLLISDKLHIVRVLSKNNASLCTFSVQQATYSNCGKLSLSIMY